MRLLGYPYGLPMMFRNIDYGVTSCEDWGFAYKAVDVTLSVESPSVDGVIVDKTTTLTILIDVVGTAEDNLNQIQTAKAVYYFDSLLRQHGHDKLLSALSGELLALLRDQLPFLTERDIDEIQTSAVDMLDSFLPREP